MARYTLDWVAVFHPRPLACGGWVGQRKEVSSSSSLEADDDSMARMKVSRILNPYPKLIGAPGRTVHARRLYEVDKNGKEVHEIYKWEVPEPAMRGNRQL
ncbi:MAG: hypothetical protein A2831_02950 [Candidatus Yanofskybacteria bacterium RIFCSPHIGHO2_01_FULL_44_17]|uniref:Uncharacterized protein n=1 Tax=Candidatus Yanofskybacteria bacterium RIFCSPHIGHO2_01_FULL_44_17 TaxID=1802668 RepID=A0A1F8EWS4_9BACT|nr:MAG: hypothetical protein A2831_02950 [Candidatus Yanofskybacteria bacterium RIFCSPHIGHO2_01_FULL_44_17]